MTEWEVKQKFKEVLGEEVQVYGHFAIGTNFTIQIIKNKVNLQFRFNLDKLDKALEMAKEMIELYEKYGIKWLAPSFSAEELQ